MIIVYSNLFFLPATLLSSGGQQKEINLTAATNCKELVPNIGSRLEMQKGNICKQLLWPGESFVVVVF